LSSPQGKDGVRAFYERFVASGAGRLQLDIDRLVVDRDCILTEGVMRMAYPGRTLRAMGIDVDDPDAHYLYEARMATLWPFDGGDEWLFELLPVVHRAEDAAPHRARVVDAECVAHARLPVLTLGDDRPRVDAHGPRAHRLPHVDVGRAGHQHVRMPDRGGQP